MDVRTSTLLGILARIRKTEDLGEPQKKALDEAVAIWAATNPLDAEALEDIIVTFTRVK
jgi:hypothetical protein